MPDKVYKLNKVRPQKTEIVKAKSSRGWGTDFPGWWVMHPEKILKLEQAFAQGNTDEDACAYADISRSQFYYWCREINPQFQQRKEDLKAQPILQMNNVLVRAAIGWREMDGETVVKIHPPDLDTAKWYLERKRRKDFALRTELTGAEGKDLGGVTAEDRKKIDAILNGKPIFTSNQTLPIGRDEANGDGNVPSAPGN